MNTTLIFDQAFNVCNQTFANYTSGEIYCVAVRKAVDDHLPPFLQKALCWGGIVPYALGNRWYDTFNKIGTYGDYCFEYGGIVGKTAWMGLTLLIIRNLSNRLIGTRNTEISKTTDIINMKDSAEITRYLMQNNMMPRG